MTTEMNKNLFLIEQLCSHHEKLMSILCKGVEAICSNVGVEHSNTREQAL